MLRTVVLTALLGLAGVALAAGQEDPYGWLEDIEGERALAWVRAQNQRTLRALEKGSDHAGLYRRLLGILDARERIPWPALRGGMVYNFWTDEAHERGILRRTSLASYRTPAPAWETVLDIDALARAEGVPWVYKGSTCLGPEERLCLVSLSRGGADSIEQREFDAARKAFVDGGFFLPEAKSTAAWKDADTLWVATDFGEGSLTTSGYPRVVKEWRRGTPLASARTIFEGRAEDVGVWPFAIETPEGRYTLITRLPRFYVADTFLGLGSRLVRLPIPEDADFKGIFRDQVLFSLRTDWKPGDTVYPGGALLAADLDGLLQGRRACDVLFEPTDRSSLNDVAFTRNLVLVSTLDNVHSRLFRLAPGAAGWTREELALPGLGVAGLTATRREDDVFFFSYEDFLTPPSLHFYSEGGAEKVKALPMQFEAAGVRVEQHEATSKDGTRIPYFLVVPWGFVADGARPTLLYGYGGFESSQLPAYSAIIGAAWLERGGVYALANIRGGGEFGPRWHQAAQQRNRIKSFEDFIAVAEDLLARKVTSPRHLGIMGGSQGGLLVGGAFALRPDLFNAVVCQVPLLDMQRYHKLLAGASWMAEYGNPDDPEDWAFIRQWSPYHLVREGVRYPKVFFWTTTRDDRVHPGHARKMVARMLGMGHPVYYFESIEGGHGAGSVNRQRAQIKALEWTYLRKMLR
ncbi:MAG TPA: prolyl oligopeptidase family serine peptidase [Thermoanaerobaculaceae bacterium]|nr:prolyl oligopeptidase family serine peptidase [Thermoanaerobaculaceae bacterium]HRS16037.1 prolyl oligopeptidase family serine peptidase [Thermoanaerobaculaceae bacterium]